MKVVRPPRVWNFIKCNQKFNPSFLKEGDKIITCEGELICENNNFVNQKVTFSLDGEGGWDYKYEILKSVYRNKSW